MKLSEDNDNKIETSKVIPTEAISVLKTAESPSISTNKHIDQSFLINPYLSPAVRKHIGCNQLNDAAIKASSPDDRLVKEDIY